MVDWLTEFISLFDHYRLMSQDYKESGALCWLNMLSLKAFPCMGEAGHNFGCLFHGYQGSGKSPLVDALNRVAGRMGLQVIPVTGTGVAKVTTDLDKDPHALLYIDESSEFFHSQPQYQIGLKRMIKSLMTGKIAGRLFKSYQTSSTVPTICVFVMTSLPWNAQITFRRDDFQDGFMSRLPVVGAGGRPSRQEIKNALKRPPPDIDITNISEFSEAVWFNESLSFSADESSKDTYGECIAKLVDAIPNSRLWEDMMVKQQWHLINVARARALSRMTLSEVKGKPCKVNVEGGDFKYALTWMEARASDLVDLWEDCRRSPESFEFVDEVDELDRLVEMLRKWHSSSDLLGQGRRFMPDVKTFEGLFYKIPGKYDMTPISTVDVPSGRGRPSKRYYLEVVCPECGETYRHGEAHKCS